MNEVIVFYKLAAVLHGEKASRITKVTIAGDGHVLGPLLRTSPV